MADEVYQIYYDISFDFIIPDKDIIVSPLKILRVEREASYFDKLFPTTRIRFSIEADQIPFLQENTKDLLVNMKILRKKYLHDPSKSIDEIRDSIEEKIIIESKYTPFFHENSFPKANISSKGTEDEGEDTSSDVSKTDVVNLSFTAYPVVSQVINKQLYNNVFDQCDVATTIDYILGTNSLLKGAIVDNPENSSTYENLIVLPGNLRAVMHNLQTRYGIYMGGMTIYLEEDFFYLLNRFASAHEYEDGDKPFNVIRMTNDASDYMNEVDLVLYDKKEIVYQSKDDLISTDESLVTGELAGDRFIMTNLSKALQMFELTNDGSLKYTEPMETYKRESLTHSKTGTKATLEYDELNNPFNLLSKLREAGKSDIYAFTLDGVDIDSTKPNKLFRFSYPTDPDFESKVSGEIFCINTVKNVFTPRSHDIGEQGFTCKSSFILIKVN